MLLSASDAAAARSRSSDSSADTSASIADCAPRADAPERSSRLYAHGPVFIVESRDEPGGRCRRAWTDAAERSRCSPASCRLRMLQLLDERGNGGARRLTDLRDRGGGAGSSTTLPLTQRGGQNGHGGRSRLAHLSQGPDREASDVAVPRADRRTERSHGGLVERGEAIEAHRRGPPHRSAIVMKRREQDRNAGSRCLPDRTKLDRGFTPHRFAGRSVEHSSQGFGRLATVLLPERPHRGALQLGLLCVPRQSDERFWRPGRPGSVEEITPPLPDQRAAPTRPASRPPTPHPSG